VTEPKTSPPPNTRSSSIEPVPSLGDSAMASAANDDETSPRLGSAFVLRGFALKISAASVFHSPQVAHCPCHFGAAAPQFWQTKTCFDFAMGVLRTDL
jgi:hypothetical protein